MSGQHGFARRFPWTLKSAIESNNTLTICMQLCHSTETLKEWPHEFTLNYWIVLHESEPALHTKLEVVNPGMKSFSFNALLHTYFAIQDAMNVKLFGQFASYFDKVADKRVENEPTLLIPLNQEMDRIYENVEGPFRIIEKMNEEVNFEFLIETTFNDLVIWNPWDKKAKAMVDFDDEEYKKMVCVEVGNVTSPVELRPGEIWQKEQKITAMTEDLYQ